MRFKMGLMVAAPLMAAALLGACSSNDSGKTQSGDFPKEASAAPLNGTPMTLAGVTFTPPAEWADQGPSGMRKASYAFGPLEGDTDSATVTVFYFGEGMGGDVDANIKRWIGQMSDHATGGACSDVQKKELEVAGMPVHAVSVMGDYSASMGGPMMGGDKTVKPGYYMSAVVLEGPQGNVFFKLTGPDKTARAMNDGFMAMLAQVQRGG